MDIKEGRLAVRVGKMEYFVPNVSSDTWNELSQYLLGSDFPTGETGFAFDHSWLAYRTFCHDRVVLTLRPVPNVVSVSISPLDSCPPEDANHPDTTMKVTITYEPDPNKPTASVSLTATLQQCMDGGIYL